jgi:hypothetical protein
MVLESHWACRFMPRFSFLTYNLIFFSIHKDFKLIHGGFEVIPHN